MNNISISVEKFYNSISIISDHRYKSWEHCHNFFVSIKDKKLTNEELDLAQLHLAFYLASWGMYRGSSFVLQKDYTIFKEIVNILLSNKYSTLWNIEKNLDKKEEMRQSFLSLYTQLENALKKIRSTLNKHPDISKDKRYLNEREIISPTLITKIILGTIGSTPAYDRFFIKGLEMNNLQQKFNPKKSFNELLNFYMHNKKEIDRLKNRLNGYTIMKVVDMYFWIIGYENSSKKKGAEEE